MSKLFFLHILLIILVHLFDVLNINSCHALHAAPLNASHFEQTFSVHV